MPTLPSKSDNSHDTARSGVVYGLCAYLIWGLFPAFFKLIHEITPLEVVAHRVIWSVILLLFLVSMSGQWPDVRRAITTPRVLLTLCGTSLLIATNWLIFIYAIATDQVLQSSLGYFINPLVSVLLGYVFLSERLRRLQKLSVLLAGVGVILITYEHGTIPWISLILAATFGLYGLLRKTAQVDALAGLTVETIITGPFALAYLSYLWYNGSGAFLSGSLKYDCLLPLSGVVTAIPLIGFAAAARRLRLATIGFLQYITPSLHFILAVWVYREPFNQSHLISFLFIWIGLGLYSADAARFILPQKS